MHNHLGFLCRELILANIAVNAEMYRVEPLNDGHGGDEHFVHCSEVVPSSEVEMYGQLMAEASSLSIVGRLSSYQCPLSEVLLYR